MHENWPRFTTLQAVSSSALLGYACGLYFLTLLQRLFKCLSNLVQAPRIGV